MVPPPRMDRQQGSSESSSDNRLTYSPSALPLSGCWADLAPSSTRSGAQFVEREPLTGSPARSARVDTKEDNRVRIALFAWETLHSIPVGGVGVHVTELAAALERRDHEVHVFTRRGHGQADHDCVHGVHYHRCDFPLSPNFVDEVNNMCRSFVHHFHAVEDHA